MYLRLFFFSITPKIKIIFVENKTNIDLTHHCKYRKAQILKFTNFKRKTYKTLTIT